MYDFNADDVFEMAEQMERNGAAFYHDAAGRTEETSAKDILLKLAQMEEQHEKTFSALRAQLSGQEQQSTVFDPDGESIHYLRSIANTKVFFEKEIDVTSLVEILKSAIEAEKDAIVFYLGIKDSVPENMGRERLDAIIKEEMGHVRLLSNELLKRK